MNCFVLFGAPFASAQEVVGTITGTLDGESRVWFVTIMDGQSQSGWADLGGLEDVKIWGHATEDTVSSPRDALTIGFKMVNGAVFPGTLGASFADTRVEGSYFTFDTGTATASLVASNVEGGSLNLEGNLSLTLAYSENYGRTLDFENTISIEASFAVAVPAK